MINTRAYACCKKELEDPLTGRYVKKQMKEFIDICEGKSDKFFIDLKIVKKIETILKLLKMPEEDEDPSQFKTIYESSIAYQWATYISAFAIFYKDNPKKKRYTQFIIKLGRKNGKSCTVGVTYILKCFMGTPGAKYYIAAPKLKYATEVLNSMQEILLASPKLLYFDKQMTKARFKFAKETIRYSKYRIVCEARTNSVAQAKKHSSLESLKSSLCTVDEVGGLSDTYTIDAMRKASGTVKTGGLTILISTAYPSPDNPFEAEVAYAKRVLDGNHPNPNSSERTFALLYEPDEELITGRKNKYAWQTNDLILRQANPLAAIDPGYMEIRKESRDQAIAAGDGSSRQVDFITKYCNISYVGLGSNGFVPLESVKECKVDKIDWTGRTVWLGLDLAQVDDNASVVMVDSNIEDKIIAQSHVFIPQDKIETKSAREHVDYNQYIKEGICTACGTDAIAYEEIEKYILGLKAKYKLGAILGLTYDGYAANYINQHLVAAGYTTYRAQYGDSAMTPPTQFLKAQILNRRFEYEENPLLEINFHNSRCIYTRTMGARLDKKVSTGKIDMVMALVYAVMGVMKLNETTQKVTTGDVIVGRNTAMQGW